MSIFDKVFGARKANTIEVAYGKDRFALDFPPGSIENGSATVGELRSLCTNITDTPAPNIRLLFRGQNLVNDTVKLASVGMKSGSRCLCMASKSTVPPERVAKTQLHTPSETEVSPLQRLNDLLQVIQRELEPSVQRYVSSIPSDPKERKDTHDRLAELLLQKLFALDGITSKDNATDGERDDLRQKRKQGVKYTQDLLDSVDLVVKKDIPESGI